MAQQTAMKQMINHLEEMKSKTTDQSEIYMLTNAWVKAIHLIQVEKEQIINAANITWGQRILVDPIYKNGGEQHYYETYNK